MLRKNGSQPFADAEGCFFIELPISKTPEATCRVYPVFFYFGSGRERIPK
jgi:hypothetical protein